MTWYFHIHLISLITLLDLLLNIFYSLVLYVITIIAIVLLLGFILVLVASRVILSLTLLNLLDWRIIVLKTLHWFLLWNLINTSWLGSCKLFHHLLLLLLDSDVFEVSPFSQDFHSLDVLDGSELVSIVFVSAKGVKVNFFAQTLVLFLYNFQNVNDLFAVVDLFIIDSNNRVENSPHNFRIVNSTKMVLDVQAENDFVEL